MDKVIECAKKGGYEFLEGNYTLAWDSILLDPKFWIACGKAEGWVWDSKSLVSGEKIATFGEDKWKDHWHHFIDWISEGREIDEFFTTLLSK